MKHFGIAVLVAIAVYAFAAFITLDPVWVLNVTNEARAVAVVLWLISFPFVCAVAEALKD